jgi:hypothetical protein
MASMPSSGILLIKHSGLPAAGEPLSVLEKKNRRGLPWLTAEETEKAGLRRVILPIDGNRIEGIKTRVVNGYRNVWQLDKDGGRQWI